MPGRENHLIERDDTPPTPPPITAPPATDPGPARRDGAGSGDFTDPVPASPITVSGGTTTPHP